VIRVFIFAESARSRERLEELLDARRIEVVGTASSVETAAEALAIDAPVNDDVRHMDALRPILARRALSHRAQRRESKDLQLLFGIQNRYYFRIGDNTSGINAAKKSRADNLCDQNN